MSKIADEEEVLEMYTAIMRCKVTDYVKDGHDPVKPADMMKAGEALLKRLDAANHAGDDTGTQYGVLIMSEVKESEKEEK